jgi:hypothetical protein
MYPHGAIEIQGMALQELQDRQSIVMGMEHCMRATAGKTGVVGPLL